MGCSMWVAELGIRKVSSDLQVTRRKSKLINLSYSVWKCQSLEWFTIRKGPIWNAIDRGCNRNVLEFGAIPKSTISNVGHISWNRDTLQRIATKMLPLQCATQSLGGLESSLGSPTNKNSVQEYDWPQTGWYCCKGARKAPVTKA